jgi:hypothetical protein
VLATHGTGELQGVGRLTAVHTEELALARHKGTVDAVFIAHLTESLVFVNRFEILRREKRDLIEEMIP